LLQQQLQRSVNETPHFLACRCRRSERPHPTNDASSIKRLANLRQEGGRGTIANVLNAAEMDPSPERRQGMTWKEFLKTHWDVLAAADFFTVELWTRWGLVLYHVVFAINLATREVQIAGMVPEPNEIWMKQVARYLIPRRGFLRGTCLLLHDCASLISEQFLRLLWSTQMEGLRLSARSPNLNAYKKRIVRTIRQGVWTAWSSFGETALRQTVYEFVIHYNQEINHQSLANQLIGPRDNRFPFRGNLCRRKRLGGLLNYYFREAAA